MQEVLTWFYETHERRSVQLPWRMVRYPRPGGLVKQDAWLMRALAFAREVVNALAIARRRPGDSDELKRFHDDERRGRQSVH